MKPELIFIPALFHMLLVFFLLFKLGKEKFRAVESGSVDRKQAALDNKAWPDNVLKVSNNIANQFETPILFYVLTIIVFLTNSVNAIAIALMGIYVASRYLHSYFHITKNYVPYRFKTFVFGFLILIGVTIWQIAVIVI